MKSQPPIVDRFQIVGFVISVAISLGLLIAGQDTLPSMVLGLVLAVLTQLFDLQFRHADAEERLLRAGVLSRALYQDEWLLRQVRQIVEDYQAVRGNWFDLFRRRANDAMSECRNTLHSMAEGYLIVEPQGPYTFGSEAFAEARRSVKATQAADVTYWRSTYAQKYFQANVDAIQRGVKIVRVFIQPWAVLQSMVDVLQKQQEVGVEVYVVQPDNLPKELNEDYLLIDERIFTCTELTGDKQPRENKISIDRAEVERMVAKFDAVLRHAKRLDDVIDRLRQ